MTIGPAGTPVSSQCHSPYLIAPSMGRMRLMTKALSSAVLVGAGARTVAGAGVWNVAAALAGAEGWVAMTRTPAITARAGAAEARRSLAPIGARLRGLASFSTRRLSRDLAEVARALTNEVPN